MTGYDYWKTGGSQHDDVDPDDDIRYHPTWCRCDLCNEDRQQHYEKTQEKKKQTAWQRVHQETKDLFAKE